MDIAQTALLLVGWIVAFMLGKELQSGFAQWQAVAPARRAERVGPRLDLPVESDGSTDRGMNPTSTLDRSLRDRAWRLHPVPCVP